MASTKQADSKADSKTNSPVVPADALWKGWLTGCSYNACKSLYFKEGVRTPKEKKDLLTWFYTYQSLADDWKIDNEHKTFIENMIHEVEKSYHIEHKSSTEPGKRFNRKIVRR